MAPPYKKAVLAPQGPLNILPQLRPCQYQNTEKATNYVWGLLVQMADHRNAGSLIRLNLSPS